MIFYQKIDRKQKTVKKMIFFFKFVFKKFFRFFRFLGLILLSKGAAKLPENEATRKFDF